MAYTEFLVYLSYNVGDVVTYNGGAYVFITAHTPGAWDYSQVVQINQTTSYASGDFNTLPNYNLSSPLGAAKYRVLYYPNNDAISIPIVSDTTAYLPGETATIQGYPYTHFSEDGIWAYSFIGWALAKGSSDDIAYEEDMEFVMGEHDLVLYAQWSKTATITVNSVGQLLLKQAYKDDIIKMIIPEYFGGTRIKSIGTDAFLNSSISEIVIPPNITDIYSNAFSGWTGTTIRFVDAEVTDKYLSLKIWADAFYDTPNLLSLTLPYRWRAASGVIFPEAADKAGIMTIYVRNTKAFMGEQLSESDAEAYISDPSNPNLNYERIFYWGYND